MKYSYYSFKDLKYYILSGAEYYREYIKSISRDSYNIFGISTTF
jgi:hypothetical protein